MIAEHLSNNSFQHDPVYDIYSRGYIDNLVQVLILHDLFKNAEDAMSTSKALAKMVLTANVTIDSIRKYLNYNNIPNAFYELVEAFYYSVLREISKRMSSPCPICDGKHGNYGLHGSWYCENGDQLPYDPELAKFYSQDKLEYCLTCNTSSNKLKFAIIAT
ncbi:hypothetical protein RclHR1_08350022 [Rhizophagus clarus]|uniref:Uncharacterized protein n=1 Tax=Rhizophagus clarus TaxID=94130 RepID=A0A2Z6SFQ4_9GLOM|nr:hypothetical protein RclHR1_08350022 [Rhizophagus clarus]